MFRKKQSKRELQQEHVKRICCENAIYHATISHFYSLEFYEQLSIGRYLYSNRLWNIFA